MRVEYKSNYRIFLRISNQINLSLRRYNIPWYATSLNVQKMILFLLQKSIKVFSLNIAGLFVGSLEGAAMVRDTSEYIVCLF